MSANNLLNILKENLENTCFDEENFLVEVNQYLSEYELNLTIDDDICIIKDKVGNNLFKSDVELCGEDEILISNIVVY